MKRVPYGSVQRDRHFQFASKVFLPPFMPYFDKYMGHIFIIDHVHPEDPSHVWMKCVDDPSIEVDGYVERDLIQ